MDFVDCTSTFSLDNVNNDKLDQISRFSASDVAAIAGHNRWKDQIELVEKYLYQDLETLRYVDAKNLDLELVHPEDEMEIGNVILNIAIA